MPVFDKRRTPAERRVAVFRWYRDTMKRVGAQLDASTDPKESERLARYALQLLDRYAVLRQMPDDYFTGVWKNGEKIGD